MLNLSQLSTRYRIKKMGEEDASIILNLEYGNPLYFEYCPPEPTHNLLAKFRKNIESCKKYNDVLPNIEVVNLQKNGQIGRAHV